jgi:amino acid adenylation domain-containing protein
MSAICPRNASFIPYDRKELDQSVPNRFEKIVASYPERLAIQSSSSHLTYDELNRTANRLAQELLQQRGRIQEPVGLVVEDECLAIAAILGVLKTGKFYVPLERSFSAVRLSAILDDCQIRVFFTEKKHRTWLEHVAALDCTIICIDDLDPRLCAENPDLTLPPDAMAAVLYTSGSTGQPKGVIQNHRTLLHRVMVCTNSLAIDRDDRFSLVSAPTYSASVRTVFSAVLNGAAVFPFNILQQGMDELGSWLSRMRISIYFSVPSVFRRWVNTLTGQEDFSRLRVIDLAGETVVSFDVDLYKRHFSSNCIFVNNLGSNEAGTMRLYFINKTTEVSEGIVPVGYEVDDKEILIIDNEGRELGCNEVGEIAVRSAFLSPGYWRNPDLTATAIRTDSGDPQKRIYHTGDLGCILPDGCLLYKGRNQFRPKIRGIGVDIHEIEAALHSHASIREALIRVREEESGEQRLIAYVVPRKNTALTTHEIRMFLADRLPTQMVPSVVISPDPLPRTFHGKIDFQALSSLDEAKPLTEHIVPPNDAIERALKMMWEMILGIRVVSVQSNFFDVGGDSLAALQMLATVKRAFRKDIPPAVLFRSPTIQELAAIVREQRPIDFWPSLVPVQPIGSKPPFFWIHGDSSSVFLSRYLGTDQPLYLLTHQSEDGRPARCKEVETIAEYYLREIRTVQKTGPFFLGGYSFGGVVALEIAQRMMRQEEQVGLLVLLDPPSLSVERYMSPSTSAPRRHHLRDLAKLSPQEQIDFVLRGITERFNSWTGPVRKAFKKTIWKICVVCGYRIPLSLRSSYILDVYQRARTRYVPQPYRGSVLLFKGTTRSYDSKSDWGELLKGQVETHEVSAHHMKLREKSEVGAWTEKLKPALLKAQCSTLRSEN